MWLKVEKADYVDMHILLLHVLYSLHTHQT